MATKESVLSKRVVSVPAFECAALSNVSEQRRLIRRGEVLGGDSGNSGEIQQGKHPGPLGVPRSRLGPAFLPALVLVGVTHSPLQPVQNVARILKGHLANIVTYAIHRLTSTVVEGLNGKT